VRLSRRAAHCGYACTVGDEQLTAAISGGVDKQPPFGMRKSILPRFAM
jgi:hypothetical protein